MNYLDKNYDQFASHYQNILTVKELQKGFSEMYLSGKKKIIYVDIFIVTNKRIYFQMDASEIEGLLYTTLSENPFKNHKINIKNTEDDWTVSDYISQNFGTRI